MGERGTPKKNRLTGSAQADWVLNFISNTKATDIPKDVRIHARYLLLDLIGVAAAGSGPHCEGRGDDAGGAGLRPLPDGVQAGRP